MGEELHRIIPAGEVLDLAGDFGEPGSSVFGSLHELDDRFSSLRLALLAVLSGFERW